MREDALLPIGVKRISGDGATPGCEWFKDCNGTDIGCGASAETGRGENAGAGRGERNVSGGTGFRKPVNGTLKKPFSLMSSIGGTSEMRRPRSDRGGGGGMDNTSEGGSSVGGGGGGTGAFSSGTGVITGFTVMGIKEDAPKAGTPPMSISSREANNGAAELGFG